MVENDVLEAESAFPAYLNSGFLILFPCSLSLVVVLQEALEPVCALVLVAGVTH